MQGAVGFHRDEPALRAKTAPLERDNFDVTGIDGATTTTSPLPTSVAVDSTGTTLAGVDIDGTKAVTVTIKTAGLTEKAPEYKADVSAVNGKTLESLSVNTANDKALTLSVAATPNTGIVANSNVKLTVKLSNAPTPTRSL